MEAFQSHLENTLFKTDQDNFYRVSIVISKLCEEEKIDVIGWKTKANAMEAILQQARIATDDIFLLYDRPWLQGDPVPSGLADVPPGTIFVAPSPAASRGLTSKSMQVLRGPAFGVLEFFNDTCAVIVGLGPSQSQKRCSRLDALSGEGVSHA